MDKLTHLYSGIVVDGVSKVVNLVIIKHSLLSLVLKICIFLPCLTYLFLKCFCRLSDSSGSNEGKQLLGLTFKRLISLLLSDSNFQLFAPTS